MEVGHWHLDEPAADNLREYPLRGGFLVHRVLPNRSIVENIAAMTGVLQAAEAFDTTLSSCADFIR